MKRSIYFFFWGGGTEGLKYNRERDQRKKKLSEEHGIKLLEWQYTVPVDETNVINFLNDNGIKIETVDNTVFFDNSLDDRVNMAPVVKQEKKKIRRTVQKVVKVYVVNYTFDGKLKNKYNTISDAAQAVGISNTSIAKVLRGERNTAGGFIWKKFSVEDDIPDTIEVTFDLSLTNSGMARKIAKIDDLGNVLQEYESIMEASKANNIKYKTMQKQIKKSQGWKYL